MHGRCRFLGEAIPAPGNDEPSLVDPSSSYSGYRHCFITVREDHRFLMLYTFLKRNADRKVMVFFSTTKSTQYYSRLLSRLRFDVRAAHNSQGRERFLEEFLRFSGAERGKLCRPDFLGGDLAIAPSCDWIVQFEPCADPSDYIFRVGPISLVERGRPRARSASS